MAGTKLNGWGKIIVASGITMILAGLSYAAVWGSLRNQQRVQDTAINALQQTKLDEKLFNQYAASLEKKLDEMKADQNARLARIENKVDDLKQN